MTVLLPEDCWAHVLVFACCGCERPARISLVSKLFARCLDKRVGTSCSRVVRFNDDMWVGQEDGPCVVCCANEHFLDRTLKAMRNLAFERVLPDFRKTYVHFEHAELGTAFAYYVRHHAHGIYPCAFCCGGKGVKVKVV